MYDYMHVCFFMVWVSVANKPFTRCLATQRH